MVTITSYPRKLPIALICVYVFIIMAVIHIYHGPFYHLDKREQDSVGFDPSQEKRVGLFGRNVDEGKSPNIKIMYRTMQDDDKPPESKPGWNSSIPEVPVKRLPKCLILGFPNCGTKTLTTLLDIHPNIVTLDLESSYFCQKTYMKYSLHWYRMLMPVSTSNQVTLESSPCYIDETEALHRIYAMNNTIKVMVMVTDPLSRIMSAQSHYASQMNLNGESPDNVEKRFFPNGSIEESQVREHGTYTEQMERVYSIFPRNQILLVDGDKFNDNPLPTLRNIERFLGIETFFSTKDVFSYNKKGVRCFKHTETKTTNCLPESNETETQKALSEEQKKKLLRFLRPFSRRFMLMTKQDFIWELGS